VNSGRWKVDHWELRPRRRGWDRAFESRRHMGMCRKHRDCHRSFGRGILRRFCAQGRIRITTGRCALWLKICAERRRSWGS